MLVWTPKPAHAAGHFAVGHAGGFGFHGGGFGGGGFRGGFHGGFRGGFCFRGGFGYGWWGWPGYGLFLATLPFYYSTVWWDGVPYYYADDYYYLWNPTAGAYQAVTPPAQIANRSALTPGSEQLFAYPKNGQSAEQQARDKQQCRDWATSQAGAGAGSSTGDNLRAQTACLSGRGYSVR
jgi:hypothetical protein